MTVSLATVVIDALDPPAQARFWARALRWPAPDEGGDELVPSDATGFTIRFRPVDDAKTIQNRIHLDLTTTSAEDQASTVADLVAHGGGHVDVGQSPEEAHVVLADPEGNELCVIEPQNRFLAGCPRLGAVNCDGTAALGRFWSRALGWPLVWDQDEETAIQAPGGVGPKITWSGPPLMPRPPRERWHLHLSPTDGATVDTAVAELLDLGATRRVDACAAAVGLSDVDGNPFCVVAR